MSSFVTNAYVAKRAIFDRLANLTAAGQPLAGVQVGYEYPPKGAERECVYGGGVTFSQTEDAVDSERDTLSAESAVIGVYIRVTDPSKDVHDTDLRCEQIGGVIAAALRSSPRLTPAVAYSQITGGQGDYSRAGEPISILKLNVTVISYLT